MKRYGVFIILMTLFLILETTIVSFPLILFWSSVFFLTRKNITLLSLSVFFAITLDYLRFSYVGVSPLFLLGMFLFITLQKSFFEAADYKIVLGFLAICVFVYSFIVAHDVTVAFALFFILNFSLSIPILKSHPAQTDTYIS